MASGGFYANKAAGAAKKVAGDQGSSATIPRGLARKLDVLGFPEIATLSLSGQSFQTCVLWLEEEKIRLYPQQDRLKLRDFGGQWWAHVIEYCAELSINATGLDSKNETVKLRVLNSLANNAVHDVYQDKTQGNELKLSSPNVAGGGKAERRLSELFEPINRMLESHSLPKLPENAPDEDTVAALRCLHARICPAEGAKPGNPLDIDDLPVGFQIEDKEVRRAAAVLRVLHGLELSQLQTNINQVIAELQQLTGDPKIDGRLGKVGK